MEKNNKKIIHFATYSDHVFIRAKKRLLKEAEQFKEFKYIHGFGREDLPKQFVEGYKSILNQRRGGGYWIWRPIIFNKLFKIMKEGEFLVYLDAGCKLNPLGKKRFFEYIDMLDKSEYGTLSIQMSGNNGFGEFYKEKNWTTKEIFNQLNISIDSDIANNGQLLGGVIIMKKCKHLQNFLDTFTTFILKYPYLCTDIFNNKNQISEFKDNRHDQSVSSLIRKKIGTVIIDGDETWISPFGKGKSLEYPFWAARSMN